MNLPSFKTMGIVGVIMAVLAYLFRDNPIMQSLLSMFGMGGNEAQASDATKTTPTSGAQGQRAAAQQPQITPEQRATNVMTEWKQQMEVANTPESVRNAIAAREQELLVKLQGAKTVKEVEVIQITALTEAAKPEFDKFIGTAKKQVTEAMDETIRMVSNNSGLPAKEKAEALKALKGEKEAMLKGLQAEFEKMTPEQRTQIALNKEVQENIKKGLAERLSGNKEEMANNVSQIVRHNNGWAWSSSILGWTAAVAGVASFIPVVNVVAFPVACAAGIGAGACKIVNNVGKGGSTAELTVGIFEAALSAAPPLMLASKSVGLFARSAEVVTTGGKIGGFSKWGAASFKNMIGWADEGERALVEGVSISHGQMLNSVKAASKVEAVSDAIKAGSIGDDMVKVEDAVLGYVRTGKKAPALDNRHAQKLVDEAIHHHYWNDPIKGVIPSSIRGVVLAGANEVDNIVPSQTPAIKTADPKTPPKTTLTF